MSEFYVLVIFNDRASTWVEVASSFDRSKLEGMLPYLAMADVLADVVTCGGDSDAAIAFVVDNLGAPAGSFARDLQDTVAALERCAGVVPLRRATDA